MSLGRVIGTSEAASTAAASGPPPGLITAESVRRKFAALDSDAAASGYAAAAPAFNTPLRAGGPSVRGSEPEPVPIRNAAPTSPAPLDNHSPIKLETRGPAQAVRFVRRGVNIGPVDGVIVDTDEPMPDGHSALPGGFGRAPVSYGASTAPTALNSTPVDTPNGSVMDAAAADCDDEESDTTLSAMDPVDDRDLPAMPDDAQPVVPGGLVHSQNVIGSKFLWQHHSAYPVVLALLKRRGVSLQQHHDVVNYHMAELFLDSINMLSRGGYFMRYVAKGSPPKERFVALRTIKEGGDTVPIFGVYNSNKSVNMTDFVRLDNVVGLTRDTTSAAFRKQLISPTMIKGTYVGGHHARVSTQGCMTIWLYDRRAREPRSLDLLTTNLTLHSRWVLAVKGLLSVNSTCVGRPTAAQEIQKLFDLALRHGNGPGSAQPPQY